MAQTDQLTKIQDVQASRPGVGVNVDRIVEDQFFVDSRRCRVIINKLSGLEYLRSLDPRDNWATLFKYAVKNPHAFDLVYDTEEQAEAAGDEGPLVSKTGQVIFTEAELLQRDIHQLREIGKAYDVTGRQKTELIQKILKAQRA